MTNIVATLVSKPATQQNHQASALNAQLQHVRFDCTAAVHDAAGRQDIITANTAVGHCTEPVRASHPMLPASSGTQAEAPAGTHSITAMKGQEAPLHTSPVAGEKVLRAAAAGAAASSAASRPRRTAPTAAKEALRSRQ